MKDSPISNTVVTVGESKPALSDFVNQQLKTEQFLAAPITIEGMDHHEMVFSGKVESAGDVQIEVVAGHAIHYLKNNVVLSGQIEFINSYSNVPFEFTKLEVDAVTIRDRAASQNKQSQSEAAETPYSLAV